MPDFRIICKAGSLLEYSKPEVVAEGTPLSPPFRAVLPPYFHVDFTIEAINELLKTEIVGGNTMRSAGICLLPAPTSEQQDTLYAFKVVWNQNGIGDLIANPESVNIVNIAVPGDLSPPSGAAVPQPNGFKGNKVWLQNLSNELQPQNPMVFAFFSCDSLQRLLDRVVDNNYTHIRFRRLLVKSKKKVKENASAATVFTNGEKENYQNLIAELAPTWAEKYNSSQTVTGLTTTDADATANEYGHPCPPVWKQDFTPENNIVGYGIVSSTETIKIANGAAIRISDLFGALSDNREAKKLLKGWKSFNETKVLIVKNRGKKLEVTNP